jgi:lipoprotein-anchoring transpeptidase ErfK/SrfK
MMISLPDNLHPLLTVVLRGASVRSLTLLAAGCVARNAEVDVTALVPRVHPTYLAMYGARPDERFPLPATDVAGVDPRYFRQEVAYPRGERPGTLVVDPGNKFLYLVR